MPFTVFRHWLQAFLALALMMTVPSLLAEETAEETEAPPQAQTEDTEAAEPLALDELVERADALMARGRAGQAWALLAPREGEFAGEIEYDYLLGTSALDTGRPGPASLAFERILVQRPNHAGARMGLARAWFALGDYERARAEFETLSGMQPPQRAQVAIERYLDVIDDRTLPPVRTRLTGHVEAGAGYDSNVNRATDDGEVFLITPDGLVFPFPVSVEEEEDDGFVRVGGGALLEHALSESVALFGGVDGDTRMHFDESDFDTLRGDLRGGVRLRTDRHYYTLGVNRGQLWVDGSRNRRVSGLNAQWRWLATRNDQVALFTQANRLRHPGSLSAQDADQVLLGATWLRNLGSSGRTRLSLTLLGGVEDARGGRLDGDKDIVGLRGGLQHLVHGDVLLVASGGWRQDSYDDINTGFNSKREDTPLDLSLSLDWRLGADWRLRPALSYLDNDSNIPLNDYDRFEASLTVRRDFR